MNKDDIKKIGNVDTALKRRVIVHYIRENNIYNMDVSEIIDMFTYTSFVLKYYRECMKGNKLWL